MLLNTDTNLVTIDEDVNEFEDFNVGTEIAKSLALATAQTAGVMAGLVVVAVALDGVPRLYRHFFKKNETPSDVPTTPETVEN